MSPHRLKTWKVHWAQNSYGSVMGQAAWWGMQERLGTWVLLPSLAACAPLCVPIFTSYTYVDSAGKHLSHGRGPATWESGFLTWTV